MDVTGAINAKITSQNATLHTGADQLAKVIQKTDPNANEYFLLNIGINSEQNLVFNLEQEDLAPWPLLAAQDNLLFRGTVFVQCSGGDAGNDQLVLWRFDTDRRAWIAVDTESGAPRWVPCSDFRGHLVAILTRYLPATATYRVFASNAWGTSPLVCK